MLLPPLRERMELLHSLLPQGPDRWESLSKGQVPSAVHCTDRASILGLWNVDFKSTQFQSQRGSLNECTDLLTGNVWSVMDDRCSFYTMSSGSLLFGWLYGQHKRLWFAFFKWSLSATDFLTKTPQVRDSVFPAGLLGSLLLKLSIELVNGSRCCRRSSLKC